jgi:hypothetical protein
VSEAESALDIEAIFAALDEHGVRYVLIGGIAGRLHGSPLVTDDVDITPAADRENYARLASALRELGAQFRVHGAPTDIPLELDDRSFDPFTTMTTRAGPLDICSRPDGTRGYPDLAEHAIEFEVFGRRVQVASLDDIIRSKRAAGRDSDLAALVVLEALRDRLRRQS